MGGDCFARRLLIRCAKDAILRGLLGCVIRHTGKEACQAPDADFCGDSLVWIRLQARLGRGRRRCGWGGRDVCC